MSKTTEPIDAESLVIVNDPTPGPGIVTYFVQAGGDGGPIKIGRTSQLYHRMVSLRSACPFECKILGLMTGDHEWKVHQAFRHIRKRGEWYEATPALLKFIEKNKFKD